MSFDRLLNHRGVVYRATEAKDELQDVVRSWSPLLAPLGLNCRPDQNWSGIQQDHGPGEQQGSTRRWFLQKGFDVAERDVLAVLSGPEAPVNVRILSVTRATTRTALHHLEVNVEVWHGSLTDPVADS